MLTIKEAMQKAAKKYPGGKRALARALQRKEAVFANKCTPGAGGHNPTGDDVVDVVNETGCPLPLQVMNHRCGFVAIPMPAMEYPADTDVVEAIADLQEDFAQTMTEIAGTMRVGRIHTAHAKEVMREGLEDLQALSVIVGHLFMMAEDNDSSS